MDSVSFAGHITFAILAEGRPSISLVAPAFLACVVFLHEAVSNCEWMQIPIIEVFCSNLRHLSIRFKDLKTMYPRPRH